MKVNHWYMDNFEEISYLFFQMIHIFLHNRNSLFFFLLLKCRLFHFDDHKESVKDICCERCVTTLRCATQLRNIFIYRSQEKLKYLSSLSLRQTRYSQCAYNGLNILLYLDALVRLVGW